MAIMRKYFNKRLFLHAFNVDDPDVFFAKNDITKWFAAKSKLKICILFKKKKKKTA